MTQSEFTKLGIHAGSSYALNDATSIHFVNGLISSLDLKASLYPCNYTDKNGLVYNSQITSNAVAGSRNNFVNGTITPVNNGFIRLDSPHTSDTSKSIANVLSSIKSNRKSNTILNAGGITIDDVLTNKSS
jgi:hypothetical protein